MVSLFVPFQLSVESVSLFREPLKYFYTDLFRDGGGGCWGYPLADQIHKVLLDGFLTDHKEYFHFKSCFCSLALNVVSLCLF